MKRLKDIEKNIDIVWDIANKYYPKIGDEQLKLLFFFVMHIENFKLVSEAEMYQGGRRYVEITFEYSSKWYKGNLKIEIEI